MPEEVKQNLTQDIPLVDIPFDQNYTPDPVPKNSVYKFMKANNLTSLSENDFLKKYSTPDKAKEIHSFMVANNLTTLKDNDFYNKYFQTEPTAVLDGGDLKKKVQTTDSGKVNYTDSKAGSEILSNGSNNNIINWIKGNPVKKDNKEVKPEQPIISDNKSLSRLGDLMKGFKQRGIKRKFGYDVNYAGEIDEKTGMPVAELKKLQRQSSSTGPVTTDYRGNIVQDLVEYNAPGGLDYVATLPSGEKVKMTSTVPIPREVIKQVHKREVGEAAINTLDKLYKEKGQKFDKNSLEGKQQIEDYINKENSGDLVSVYGNFDQKPYLVRGRGFWESGTKQLVQSAVDPVLYTDINTTFNPSDLADKLDARIEAEGNIPESAPNSWGRYGEMAGGLPKMALLLSTPFAGEAALVTDVYQNGMARQKMILYQKGLNEGLDRIEAARRAMSAAPAVAAPEAIVNLAMARGVGNFGRDVSKIGQSSSEAIASNLTKDVGKSIIPEAAKNTFKNALKNSAKSTAAITAMGAGSGAAEGLVERQAGYKVSNQDIINKTLEGGKDYLFMDLAFKALHGAANAPAYLRSASKNLLNEIPTEILEAHAETIPDGGEILQKLGNFSEAKNQVKGLVSDEKIASVAGLTEKINNINKTIDDLNKRKNSSTEALKPIVDNLIKEQQEQLNYYNEQVKKVVESKDPTGISEELDELTGEKAGTSNLDLPKEKLPITEYGKTPETKEESVNKLIKIFVPKIEDPNFEITNWDKNLVNQIKNNPIEFIDNLLDVNKRELEGNPQFPNAEFLNNLTKKLEDVKQNYLNAEKAEGKQEVVTSEKGVKPTDIEAQKADIERRRQEDLSKLPNKGNIEGDLITVKSNEADAIDAKYDKELKDLESGKAEVKPTEEIPEVTVEGLTEGYKVLGGKKENAVGDIRQEANEARIAGKDTFTKETVKDGKKTFTLVDTTTTDSVGRPAYKSASITLPEGTKLTIEDVMPKLKAELGIKEEVKPTDVGKTENTEKQEAINKANKQLQSTIEKNNREWQEANIDKEEHPLIVGDKLAEGVIIKIGEVVDYRENNNGKRLGKGVPEGGVPVVTSIEDLGNLNKQGKVDVGIFNSKEEANKWLADRDARVKQSYENKLSKIDAKYAETATLEGGKKENINIKNIVDEKGNINAYSLKAAIVDAPALINVNEKTIENTVGHLRQIADKVNDKELNDTVTYLEDASNMLLSLKNMEEGKRNEFLSNQENFYSDKKPPSEVLKRLDDWAKVLKGNTAKNNAERLLKEQYQQVLGEIQKRFIDEKQQPNRPKLLEAPVEKEVFKSSQGYTVDIENGKLIVKDKKGEVLSDRASKKAIEEYAENFDYSKGEKAPEVPSEITNSRDAAKYVIEESSNPIEIAEIYASEDLLPKESNPKFQAIAEYGLGRIKTSSYKNLGDPNKIEKSMYLKIFSEERGIPIDVLAKSISDKYEGLSIEPQDIVDYIEKYSKGDKGALEFKESDIALQAADKFNKLTGLDLNSELANNIIDNKLGKANKEQLDIIKEDYETAKQLEDAYWAEYKKTDGFTKESNIGEANKPEAAKEPQKKLEQAYKDLTNIEKRQIINSKFEELLKELKIEKICPTD